MERELELDILKSFLCEGTAGRALEVLFKLSGFVAVIEGYCGLNMPWEDLIV